MITTLEYGEAWIGSVQNINYQVFREEDERIGVYDEDGDLDFYLPSNTPLELIPEIIKIKRNAYEEGIRVGKLTKQDEIRKVLGIE